MIQAGKLADCGHDDKPMPAFSAHLAGLCEKDRIQLESWLAEFDETWRDGHVDAWAKKLAGHPLRRPALLEMIKIELERQWCKGRRSVLEAYLKSYPELGSAATVPVELIHLEFELRREHGAPAGPDLVDRRFPGRRTELEQLERLARQDDPGPAIRQAAHESLADPNSTLNDDRVVVMPASLPEQFGRYRILRKLGRGGMGSVYLAHDTQLDRRVALKVPHFLPTDDPDILERFHREARAAATLQHAHICPVYDVGAQAGIHYLTMAFIEGKSLADVIKEAKVLPQRQAAGWVRQLALALQEAHDMGVIHRDLKPANIIINQRQEPVVMDFGLARRAHAGDIQLTHAGSVLGTPAYMSPEQVRGDLPTMGPCCDIYSLGVILYECITGRPPFISPGMGILTQILNDEPEPASRLRPDLDPELDRICARSMAKRIEQRYPTMKALAADLGDYLTPSVVLAPPPLPAGNVVAALPVAASPVPALPGSALPVAAIAAGPPPQAIPILAATPPPQRALPSDSGVASAWGRIGPSIRSRWRWLARVAAGVIFVILLIALFASRAPSPEARRQSADLELDKGKLALQARDLPTAVAAFSRSIELDPDRAETYHLRGRAYLQQREFSLAIADFTHCLDLQPRQTDVIVDRGQARAGRHDLGKALGDLNGALLLDPGRPDALVARARVYLERGFIENKSSDYAKAIVDCDSALRSEPGLPVAHAVRGAAHAQRGDFARAIADCDEALKLDDKLALAYAVRGGAMLDKKDHKQALQDCDRALTLDPALVEGYLARGQLRQIERRHDKALADYDKAVQVDARDAIAYLRRGLLRYLLREDGLAIKDFDQAINLQPTFALAFNARANAYSFMRNHDAALADHNQALALNPGRTIFLVNRGLTYMRKKDFDRATADMKQIIDTPPFDAAGYYGLGLIYHRQKKLKDAEIQFSNAIAQAADRVDYRAALGSLLIDMKELDRAAESFQEGLKRDPGHAGCLGGMGRLLGTRGKHAEAIDYLTSAIKSDSRDPVFFLERARAYEALGDAKKSLDDLNHAAKLQRDQAAPSTELTARDYHGLGKAHAAHNSFQDAVKYFTQAITLDATEPAYYLDRAAAYAKLGDAARADQDRATARKLTRK
ncbi:MAG: tetratricopeptide repeat protein [Planctomycetes bacterium]|nr:tetratricopeptide repeat protein [Planctomycetota bacterium]